MWIPLSRGCSRPSWRRRTAPCWHGSGSSKRTYKKGPFYADALKAALRRLEPRPHEDMDFFLARVDNFYRLHFALNVLVDEAEFVRHVYHGLCRADKTHEETHRRLMAALAANRSTVALISEWALAQEFYREEHEARMCNATPNSACQPLGRQPSAMILAARPLSPHPPAEPHQHYPMVHAARAPFPDDFEK